MNSMLPAPRDLPPRRRNEIRIELQRTIAQEPPSRRPRYAPLVVGIVAVAVLTAVVVFVPWQGSTPPAAQQSFPPAGSTAAPPPSASTITSTAPTTVFVDPPVPNIKEIEAGCSAIAGRGPATLFNLVNDEAGQFALLYNQDTALDCTIGGRGMPYNSGLAGLQDWNWLPGEISVDLKGASAGGSTADSKPQYRGERGYQVAAGRISPKVVRVTYAEGSRSVDAALANGTFVARIVHSDTWRIPTGSTTGSIRAYDANGKLVGESATLGDSCYATPEGKIIGVRAATDPKTCLPAVRWR